MAWPDATSPGKFCGNQQRAVIDLLSTQVADALAWSEVLARDRPNDNSTGNFAENLTEFDRLADPELMGTLATGQARDLAQGTLVGELDPPDRFANITGGKFTGAKFTGVDEMQGIAAVGPIDQVVGHRCGSQRRFPGNQC